MLDDLRCARLHFGLTDRDLAVLHALISFHPAREINAGDGCTVYPSNKTLGDRAHGMAESTLRRHLAVLVDAGLIVRHDSPNGKRYAAKDRSGTVVRAFGFDLRPLAVRASQIASVATQTNEAALALRRLREDVVLLLRDTCKLIAYGAQTQPDSNWSTFEDTTDVLRKSLRRKLDCDVLSAMKSQVSDILTTVHQRLEAGQTHQDTDEMSGSDGQSERHHQNSIKDISGFVSCLGTTAPDSDVRPRTQSNDTVPDPNEPSSTLPLSVVLKACPDVLPYADGPIRHWHQLIATASHVRGMMGITPHAWQEAQRIMGRQTAAVTCVAILQRVGDIHNPGGYLRALTARSVTQGFSPGPMVMALLNAQGSS